MSDWIDIRDKVSLRDQPVLRFTTNLVYTSRTTVSDETAEGLVTRIRSMKITPSNLWKHAREGRIVVHDWDFATQELPLPGSMMNERGDFILDDLVKYDEGIDVLVKRPDVQQVKSVALYTLCKSLAPSHNRQARKRPISAGEMVDKITSENGSRHTDLLIEHNTMFCDRNAVIEVFCKADRPHKEYIPPKENVVRLITEWRKMGFPQVYMGLFYIVSILAFEHPVRREVAHFARTRTVMAKIVRSFMYSVIEMS